MAVIVVAAVTIYVNCQAAETVNQRGVAESTQWAMLLPILLLLVLGLVQTGVWLYSRTVAAQAAAAVADLRATGPAADDAARQAGPADRHRRRPGAGGDRRRRPTAVTWW